MNFLLRDIIVPEVLYRNIPAIYLVGGVALLIASPNIAVTIFGGLLIPGAGVVLLARNVL